MSAKKVPYGFVPTQISGCVLWLDGADSSTVTLSSSAITQWNDKSTSANHFVQATTANSPTVGTSANGLPTIYFASANQQLVSSQNNATSGNASRTVIQVFWCPTSSSGYYSVTGTESGASPPTAWGHCKNPNADIDYPFMYSSAGYDIYTFENSTPNPIITYCQYDSTASTISAYYATSGATNGTTTVGNFTTRSTAFNTTAGVWYLGRRQQAATGSVTSHLLEMIQYNKPLSTTERQNIESYLAQKWSLSSTLSVGHPGLTTTVYNSDYIKNTVPKNFTKPIPYFAAFSPRQIPGCSLWMDGADSSTMTQASNFISAWTSKGNNALSFTQATSTKQPQLVRNVYNGNSVVRCINPGDPVVNVFIDTVNNAVLQTGASFCIFIVHNPTIANGSPFCFQNGGVNRISCHLTENGNVVFDTPNVRLTYAAPGNYLTSGLKLDVFWSVANAINYRASGSATASASAGPSSWTDGTLTFGSFTPTQASYYYQTDIGEIIWFNTALLLTQVQQVESYLAQKWGLTASLPGGHSHFTQQTGAVTTTALSKLRVLGISRGASFSPTSIAGIQMWMDASDSSTASMTLSGSTVTVWKDKSGLGNNTTAYSGTPSLVSNAINGKSAISMAGGYFTGPFATANTGTQLHAFGVMSIDSSGTGSWPRPLSLGRPGANDYSDSTTTFAIIRYNGSQAVGIGRNGQYLSVAIPAYSTPFLVQSSHNGATEYMSVNGDLTVSSANTGQSGNFNITSYGLGVNTNTGDYFVWNGYYAEVLCFNVQLSDTNRQKIEGYLAWKWGLQSSLPAGHPYKSAAP